MAKRLLSIILTVVLLVSMCPPLLAAPVETNYALGKPYTVSTASQASFGNAGTIVTDGNKYSTSYITDNGAGGGAPVSLTVDLKSTYTLHEIRVWHYWADGRTFHNTKTEVSEDGTSWTTVSDSVYSGEYKESEQGRLITFNPTKARYIRDWAGGSDKDSESRWVEIQAFGPPQTGQDAKQNLPLKDSLESTANITGLSPGTVTLTQDKKGGKYAVQLNAGDSTVSDWVYCNLTSSDPFEISQYNQVKLWVKPQAGAKWVEFYTRDVTGSTDCLIKSDQDGDGKFRVGSDLISGKWNQVTLDLTKTSSPSLVQAQNLWVRFNDTSTWSFDEITSVYSPAFKLDLSKMVNSKTQLVNGELQFKPGTGANTYDTTPTVLTTQRQSNFDLTHSSQADFQGAKNGVVASESGSLELQKRSSYSDTATTTTEFEKGTHASTQAVNDSIQLAGSSVDLYTKLLLHGDGTNGSTAFIDSSGTNKTVSVGAGSPVTSTAQSKFGGSSIYIPSGSRVDISNSADFDFGSGNFTVDWWEYRTSLTDGGVAINRGENINYTPWMFGYCYSGNVYAYLSSTGTSWDATINMGAVTLNTWTHWAVVRSGNNIYTFKNGQLTSTTSYTATIPTVSSNLSLGKYWSTTVFNGYVDELRISKGSDRWTSTFTAPSSPYGASSDITDRTKAISGGDYSTAVKGNAFDNIWDGSGAWCSSQFDTAVNGNAYIGQDWGNGNNKTIKRIKFQQGPGVNNCVSSIKIQTTSDGSTWTNLQTSSVTQDGSQQEIIINNPITARGIRLLANSGVASGNVWKVDEIEMYEGTVGYSTSGTYTHTIHDLSGAGTANNLTIDYNKITPPNTTLEVEVATSSDGGSTWSSWAEKNKGDIIVPNGTNLSNCRVQWRAHLSTTDTSITPSLDYVTISNSNSDYSNILTSTADFNGERNRTEAVSDSVKLAKISSRPVLHFDGVNDYSSVPDHSGLNFGIGNFTIEGNVKLSQLNKNHTLISKGRAGYGVTYYPVYDFRINSSNKLNLHIEGTSSTYSVDATGNTVLSPDTSYHVACVRNGSNVYVYLNGVQDGAGINNNIANLNNSYSLYMGAVDINGTLGSFLKGMFSEARIWNVARTQAEIQANIGVDINPATPGLVACWKMDEGTGTIINDSTANNHDGTIYGATWTTDDPYTKLLLHCDGTDGSTTFPDSGTGKTVTANGDVKVKTVESKFGGASAYFDGNGDYLSLTDSEDWNFGSGDFTVDFWAKRNRSSIQEMVIGQGSGANAESSFWLQYTNSNTIKAAVFSGATTYYYVESTTTFADTNWHHIALVRNGNVLLLFVDGVKVSTNSVSEVALINSTKPLAIGRHGDLSDYYFNGYVDELRISKGTARWIDTFTPPASQYNVCNYQTLGTYTHTQDLSSAGTANNLTISYTKTTPPNTSVTLEYTTSTDGGNTWIAEWKPVSDNGAVIVPNGTNLSNYLIKWKATLETSDTSVTPSLDEVKIVNNGNYVTSGIYESPDLDISSAGSADGSSISWNKQDAVIGGSVVGSVQVETCLSTDSGNNYSPWQIATSGGSIPGITPETNLSAAKLKYKVTMNTSDVTITPYLNDISLFINVTGNNDPVLLPKGKISGISINSSYVSAAGPVSALPSQRVHLAGISPAVLGMSGDGNTLIYKNPQDAGKLYLLDLLTGANTLAGSASPSAIKVNYSGSKAAFKDSGNTLHLYDRASNGVTSVSSSVGAFDIQNDGTLFYHNGSICRRAPGDSTGANILSQSASYLAMAKTGSQGFFSSAADLYSLNNTPAGWKSNKLTTAAKNIDGLWAISDGSLAFYKTADGWFSYQLTTKSVRKLDLTASSVVRVTGDNRLAVLGVNNEFSLYDPDTDAVTDIRPADASGAVFDVDTTGGRVAYIAGSSLATASQGVSQRPERYLISFNDDGNWYTRKTGKWEIVKSGSVPTVDDLLKSGMTIDQVNALKSGDFEDLYRDGREIYSLDVAIYFASVDPYTTPSLKGITVLMKGGLTAGDLAETPLASMLHAKKQQDFNASGWRQIKRIYSVELYPRDAETYYFITTDGAIFKSYKNRQWVTVDPALLADPDLDKKWIDITQQGMTASELRAIPEAFLSSLLPADTFSVVYVQKVQDETTEGYTSQVSIDYTATEFVSANLVLKITFTDGTVKSYPNLTKAEVEDFMSWLSKRQYNKGPIFRKVVTGSPTPGVTQVNDYINYYLVQFVSVEEMQ
ncbi:MAG: LamG-like jellyroll fold domain-containing protein [Bacillota bacterium]